MNLFKKQMEICKMKNKNSSKFIGLLIQLRVTN